MASKNLDGMLFPTFFPEKNFYLMKNLPLRDNDVVITTYPKCGTNWVSYILYGILHPDEPPPEDGNRVSDYCAFVDFKGLGDWETSPEGEGRVLVTHLPFDYLQTNPNTKFIPVLRNPLDCCVSYYHFLKTEYKYSNTEQEIPTEFFEDFVKGNVIFGEYYKHFKSLYGRRDDPNVHVLVFEKLKANPREEILSLARFLGHGSKLQENNCVLLDKIVELSSFGTMKDKVTYKGKGGVLVKMLRKGEVGSYRESLTDEQIRILKEQMEIELAGTEILDFWRNI